MSDKNTADRIFERVWLDRIEGTDSTDSQSLKAWDETKHKRHSKGDGRGGEFAPKEGSDSHTPAIEQQELPFPGRQGRLPFRATKPGRTADTPRGRNPLKDRLGEDAQPPSPTVKPTKPATPKPTREPEPITQPEPLSKEQKASEAKLREIMQHLPEDFRMSSVANSIVLPNGSYVDVDEDPIKGLKQVHDILDEHGHDPETVVQESKLKKIGAEFLDDIEPEEDGNLIQSRRSNAGYNVEYTTPDSWHNVDDYTQRNVMERWRDDQRMTIENDHEFYQETRSEAENFADQKIDNYSSAYIAEQIQSEMNGMNGFEESTVDDIEAMLNDGERTATEVRDSFVIKRRDEIIDELMEGNFYSARLSERINSNEDAMESYEWYRYADDQGFLGQDDGVGNPEVSSKLDELGLHIDDLATMMGSPDDWDFEVTYNAEKDGIRCKYDDRENTLIRVFHRNENGDLAVYNEHFAIDDDQPKGMGLEIFSRAVAACKEKGVVEFKTHAAGTGGVIGKGAYVGFAVWPTYGYTFPIDGLSERTQDKVADEYPDATDVQDIFDEPGGRDWWWKNGSSLYNSDYNGETEYAKFDLTDGSRSLKVLQRYMAKKKASRDKVRGN